VNTVPEIDACDCLNESCPVCLLSGKVKFARLTEPRKEEPEPVEDEEPVEQPKPKTAPKSLFD